MANNGIFQNQRSTADNPATVARQVGGETGERDSRILSIRLRLREKAIGCSSMPIFTTIFFVSAIYVILIRTEEGLTSCHQEKMTANCHQAAQPTVNKRSERLRKLAMNDRFSVFFFFSRNDRSAQPPPEKFTPAVVVIMVETITFSKRNLGYPLL